MKRSGIGDDEVMRWSSARGTVLDDPVLHTYIERSAMVLICPNQYKIHLNK